MFNVRNWLSDPRIWMLILVIFSTIFSYVSKVMPFARSAGYPINALGILPHFYNNRFWRCAVQFGIIFLFCNAPFAGANSNFVVIRAGYKKWFAGQILYILTASFAYVAFVFASMVISAFPNFTFEKNWGKIFGTLARTLGSENDVPLWFDYGMNLNYTVGEAFVHTFLLLSLFAFFLGLVVFFFNSFIGKTSGMIAAAVIILFPLAAEWGNWWQPGILTRISPSSMTEIMNLDSRNMTELPPVSYAYTALILLSAIMILLTFLTIKSGAKPYKKFKENMGVWAL